MASYSAARRALFEMLPSGAPGVINADDPQGARLAATTPRALTFAIDRPADVAPGPIDQSVEGLRVDVRSSRGTIQVPTRLAGRPNVYNILAASAAALALDLPTAAIERGVADVTVVPGRLQ